MLLLRYSTAFICAVFIITGAVSGEDKAVGQTVSFRPNNVVPPVSSIIWKQKTSVVTVKAIEWDVDDGVSIPNPRFQGITTLDKETGEITISKLSVEHSGEYTIDINSKEQEQKFTLNVMKPVPKPEITKEESSNPDVVYLRCVYNEMIIWKNSSGETLKGKKNHKQGEFITVENTRNPENFYTCTLKNAVSEETSDPVTEREIFGTESNAGLIAGIVIFVILLLLVISLICIYLLKESIYNRVNERCPCIESVLSYVDCCKTKRKQYNLASKGDELKEDAGSPGNEMKEVAVSPGNEMKEVAVSPGDKLKEVAVSPGDEMKEGAVSPGDEMKEGAVSPGNEMKEGAVTPGDKLKEDAVSPGDEMKEGAVSPSDELKEVAVSPGDEMKEGAVSPVSMSLTTDQKNVYENGISDATQSQNQ